MLGKDAPRNLEEESPNQQTDQQIQSYTNTC
jgi:hypothetical protein